MARTGKVARTVVEKARDGRLVVEPVTKPRMKPSRKYIQTLRELGAPVETVELATGKRKFRKYAH